MKVSKVLSLTLLSFGLTLNLTVVLSATDYCDANLCGSRSRHIACNNRGALARSCSSDAKLMPIGNDLKEAIVDKHNSLRNKVAKGGFAGFKAAARMATMKWNNELAKIASFNVKKCILAHDACFNTADFKYAGQNLAWSAWSGQKMLLKELTLNQIELWFSEYKDTSSAAIDEYHNPRDGSVIGHFTQIIQEKATDVGCAILRQSKSGMIEQYLACNYAFTNMMGEPVYETSSRAASKCRTGANTKYRYLCSLNERYNVNDFRK